MDTVRRQINPVQNLLSSILLLFIIISFCLTRRVSLQNFKPNSLYYLRLLLVYNMLFSSRFNQTKDMYWGISIILLTIGFTPAPCYFFFLNPKYFPPYDVLIRSQSMFFPCGRNITWRILKIQINLQERYWNWWKGNGLKYYIELKTTRRC